MPEVFASDSAFSRAEQQMMAELAELMVPVDDHYNVPSAADPLILARIVSAAAEHEAVIKSALERVATIIGEAGIAVQQAIAQLQGQRQLAPFVSIVMQCYYTDDRVLAALNKEVRPPFPAGYDIPQGDWSLLVPVQARGKIWRDVP